MDCANSAQPVTLVVIVPVCSSQPQPHSSTRVAWTRSTGYTVFSNSVGPCRGFPAPVQPQASRKRGTITSHSTRIRSSASLLHSPVNSSVMWPLNLFLQCSVAIVSAQLPATLPTLVRTLICLLPAVESAIAAGLKPPIVITYFRHIISPFFDLCHITASVTTS